MEIDKKEKGLHPRNIHNEDYNYDELVKDSPELAPFVKENKYSNMSIQFSDANAVLALNKALLSYHYNIKNWTIPKGHLCPAIPGRVDYIHYIGDLLGESHEGVPPTGTNIKGLDIGTGTSCIYPLLGNSVYGWKFVGTDIDSDAVNHAKGLINANESLKKKIKIRFQKSADNIFLNIIKPDEKFDFTMCNPPFYTSLEEANNASDRKVKNLNNNKKKKGHDPIKNKKGSNFGGKKSELWCPGGEAAFITKMINESVQVKNQVRWFTTLVSNKDLLTEFNQLLQKLSRAEVRIYQMNHGQKISHILAWCF